MQRDSPEAVQVGLGGYPGLARHAYEEWEVPEKAGEEERVMMCGETSELW